MLGAAKFLLGTVCAITACMALSAHARAGAFAVGDLSAAADGEAFAGAAAGAGGLAAAFANPATMTQMHGWQSMSTVSAVLPSATITPQAGTSPVLMPLGASGQIDRDALVPSSAMSYQVNRSLWLGLLSDSPYGLMTKQSAPWAGSIYGNTSKVFSLAAMPTAALKVNDWLSVGAGVEALYFSTRQTFSFPPPNSAVSGALSGHSWGFGYNFGATITPRAGTEIGVGYHSGIREDLKGMLVVPGAYNSAIQTSIALPASVDAGLRQRLTDKLVGNIGYTWTDWSTFNSFPIYFRGTGTQVPAPFGTVSYKYRDGHRFSVGGDYLLNPRLILRAGLGYEISPITDANRGVRVPDSDRVLTSVGASYRVSAKMSVDFAYMHMFMLGHRVDIVNGNPAYSASLPLALVGALGSHVDVISASLNYRWDSPEASAPLVRKY